MAGLGVNGAAPENKLRCRFCRSPLNQSFIDLGSMPLANSYVAPDRLAFPDKSYPLHARVCSECFLVQVDEVVPAEEIFSDYAYFSSYAASWVEYARRYCVTMTSRFELNGKSKVVEVASNDGYLLRHFVAAGISVLGVEPAANVAKVAKEMGVPTEVAFFGAATAGRLKALGHAADLMVANNVLAHVPDINDFVAGFAVLLKPAGVWTIEFPHLQRLIQEGQFDTIYHEHYSYLSLGTVERILAAHRLRAFDVEELPTHGGSLRVYVCHMEAEHETSESLLDVREREQDFGMDMPETYQGFGARAGKVKLALLDFLNEAKRRGKKVAAYGAAAKGNTLLNFCGVTADLITFVADSNPHKQGRYLPGSRIPILTPGAIFAARPDYVLILPWNLADEISRNMAGIKDWGGKFVTPIPMLRILD
ncbi:MAG: class I SAM-dependent methyltransferase [Alphaproteobacteria bacterium]